MKNLVENRGRWDAGFRSPLLRLLLLFLQMGPCYCSNQICQCLFLKALARVDAEKHRGRRLSFGDGVLAGRGLGRQRICAAASARRNTSTWTAAGNREGQSVPRCQGF